MANTSKLHVRTDPADREKAAAILDSLDESFYDENMLLKQMIIPERIPFEMKLSHPAYTIEESIDETMASMSMEGMSLTDEEVQMLTDYSHGKVSGDELRRQIYATITEND